MFGLRLQEILPIVLIAALLFGASRLPQLGSSLGSAIRNFKKGFSGEEENNENQDANAPNTQIPKATTTQNVEPSKTSSKPS